MKIVLSEMEQYYIDDKNTSTNLYLILLFESYTEPL